MRHHRITSFELATAADVDAAAVELQARADAQHIDADIRVVRLGEGAGVLLVRTEASALDELSRTLLDPWLDALDLVEPSTTRVGVEAGSPEVEVLDDASRRERFVRDVSASEVVWGLYDETWARSTAAGDREALPFWTTRAAAAACVDGAWSSFVPRAIDLDAFVDQWLVGMIEDRIVALLLPTPAHSGVLAEPAELIEQLRPPDPEP